MSNKIIYCLFSILLCFSACTVQKTSSFKALHEQRPDAVWVVAHRANTGENLYPENSLESIRSCIKHDIDIVEIDVRETADGELVIMHDKTVDRTTNGTGKVEDLTLSQIRQLKLTHNGTVTPYGVPTLVEVYSLIKGKILVDLDIKLDGLPSYRKIVDLATKHQVSEQLLIFLYDKDDVQPLYQMTKDMIIFPRANSLEDMKFLSAYDYVKMIHIDHSFYEGQAMKGYIDKGYRIWMNSLGKYDKMEQAGQNGFEAFYANTPHVNIIQTDLALQLITFLKSKKLRN